MILIDSVGIGDIVLQLSALHNLNKFMKNKSEYKLYLAANTIICNFLRNIESTFDMELIEVDFSIENKSVLARWNKLAFTLPSSRFLLKF